MKTSNNQWAGLKGDDLEALKDHIKAFFANHDHQEKVLIELYQMVFPDWDKIEAIKGYPEIGDDFWKFICREFQAFDQKYHPDCLAGGAWMNWGFSINAKLAPWDISLQNCTVIYSS